MPGRIDMYFPPEDNASKVFKMPNAELRVIESVYGHGGPRFSNDEDDAFIDQALFGFDGHDQTKIDRHANFVADFF